VKAALYLRVSTIEQSVEVTNRRHHGLTKGQHVQVSRCGKIAKGANLYAFLRDRQIVVGPLYSLQLAVRFGLDVPEAYALPLAV
jgi:hypothetical protein